MRYVSTRGGGEPRSFMDILLEGLAPDGGLYMPEHFPKLDLFDLRHANYYGVALYIFRVFAPDIRPEALAAIIANSYTESAFGSKQIVPLKMLEDGFGLMQLSNGPTLAFKDLPLQLLGNLMAFALEESKSYLNVLGATSGDTGSAAAYALRGKARMNLFMLSPAGRMSVFQQKQMYTLQDANIHNVVVDGTFDDCQDIVKAINRDAAFKQRYKLGAVNSINWARIAAQVVYYVWSYIQATERNDERVTFVVPSGNFGNAFAAYVAKEMGLPIDIIVATNSNDVLDEFFRTDGTYRIRKGAEVNVTSSPSMDIASSSNFERLVYLLAGRNPETVRDLWDQIGRTNMFEASFLKCFEQTGIVSGSADDTQVLKMIGDIHNHFGYIVDPHTAVGIIVGSRYRKPGQLMLVAETAQAAKFEDTVRDAIGSPPPVPAAFRELLKLPERVISVKAEEAEVKAVIEERLAA